MLHHRDVAVGGLLLNVDLVVFNVLEFNFLVFLGFGVNGWASESRIER